MLIDDLLPTFDVSDGLGIVVAADAERTWEALMGVDLIDLGHRRPLVGVLGALRVLPEIASHLIHGETPPAAPKRLHLRDTATMPADQGGWILLGERPGEELALGLVGKFWRPVIEYAEVAPEDFTAFAEPGWAKTVYALSLQPTQDAGRTLLTGTMRTATTDAHARRWFRRYWTFGVGSGAHLLVSAVLEATRDEAERP